MTSDDPTARQLEIKTDPSLIAQYGWATLASEELGLLGLIGASELEAAGRWIGRQQPHIPRIHGIVLRDWLDAQRWIMLARPDAEVALLGVRKSGQRSYLAW